jgi:hypothetical protein
LGLVFMSVAPQGLGLENRGKKCWVGRCRKMDQKAAPKTFGAAGFPVSVVG